MNLYKKCTAKSYCFFVVYDDDDGDDDDDLFFVVWLTNERRLAIFSAGPLSEILTIDQNLNLRRTRVQVLLNERI